jgi:hypothetical protein
MSDTALITAHDRGRTRDREAATGSANLRVCRQRDDEYETPLHCGGPAMMLVRPPMTMNVAQRHDGLELLRSLPVACTPLVFLDPQHRAVVDRLKFGNEGARHCGRAELPAMSEDYIDAVCRESARMLKGGGYLMRWIDTFCLCEGPHLRIADSVKPVDLMAWDNLRPGKGKRTRRRGDYLPDPAKASGFRPHLAGSRNPEPLAGES